MFSGVLRDLSARKALEREVLDVATMEQRRIGQELHEPTGQELTALGLLAESLVEAVAKRAPAETALAAKIAEGLKRVLGQVRALSRGLIPVEVDAAGLMAALAELATQTSELHGVNCTFDCREPVLVARQRDGHAPLPHCPGSSHQCPQAQWGEEYHDKPARRREVGHAPSPGRRRRVPTRAGGNQGDGPEDHALPGGAHQCQADRRSGGAGRYRSCPASSIREPTMSKSKIKPSKPAATVLIVDDHPAVREALAIRIGAGRPDLRGMRRGGRRQRSHSARRQQPIRTWPLSTSR